MNRIESNTAVSYSYRQHYLLGGARISGKGVVIGQTIVGSEDAYIIKPQDGSDCIHVRAAGVRPEAA